MIFNTFAVQHYWFRVTMPEISNWTTRITDYNSGYKSFWRSRIKTRRWNSHRVNYSTRACSVILLAEVDYQQSLWSSYFAKRIIRKLLVASIFLLIVWATSTFLPWWLFSTEQQATLEFASFSFFFLIISPEWLSLVISFSYYQSPFLHFTTITF